MVRIALIGNSHAESVQLPALRYLGNNEVVGIAGRDLAKAQASAARWAIQHATADWRTLFEQAPDRESAVLYLSALPRGNHDKSPAADGRFDAHRPS